MDLAWQFTYIDGLIIAIIIFAVVGFFYIRNILRRANSEQLDKKFIKEQWKKTKELLDFGQEMNYKLAVIEADKLLDFVLKSYYFNGQKMSERLKQATYRFPELKKVFWAHRVRNQVVHEARYVLKYSEAKKVLELFERALKVLGAL